jgi:methyl-accepting chemotaxis protein
MLILAAITFIGFGIIFFLGAHLVRDVKIGSDRYVKIRNYHQALEKISVLKSDFNQIRAEYLTLVEESNPEIQKQGLAVIYSLNNHVNQTFSEILSVIPKEHQKPFTDARDEWQVFTDNMSGKIIPVILEGNKVLALERLQSIQRYRYERVFTGLSAVTVTLNGLSADLEKSTENYIGKRISAIILISTLIALIILVITIIITSLIVRPLHRAVKFAQDVSSGDLSRNLHEPINDEVGVLAASLNAMVSGLGQLFEKIHTASSELFDVSRTVSITSEKVSKETQIQTDSIAHSSSAINEISQATQNILSDVTNLSLSNHSTHSSVNEMVASISEIVNFSERLTNLSDEVNVSISAINNSIQTLDSNIENLNNKASETSSSITLLEDSAMIIQQKSLTTLHLAEQATKYAASGQDTVKATITSMNEIRTSSKIAFDVIADLSASAEDIGAILTVINEINDRITLLALNARIISAQAGESGNAFGVVASEFKSLSLQTGQSTLEISQKIERVQSQTKMAVEAIRKTELVVSKGESLSCLSGEALDKIVAAVRQTSQEMDAIAISTEMQRNGSNQITEAVKNVFTSLHQIAEASHELKQESIHIISNSEQMTYMADNVSRAIKENESAAKHISNASENITLMIEQIRTNCEAETVESSRILNAMEEINSTLISNLASAESASHASNMLIHQVEILISAVNQFKRK